MQQKILKINATNARKNLFQLIDNVLTGELEVLISKDGTNNSVCLTKATNRFTNYKIKDASSSVDELYGSIKTTGYNPKEMSIAKAKFVKEYKDKK